MGEVRSPKEDLIARLTQLGASDEEIAETADAFDSAPLDVVDKLLNMTDPELRTLIVEERKEFYEATTTEEEEAEQRARIAEAQRLVDLRNDAAAAVEQPVEAVLAWIMAEDTIDRAEAVLEHETAPSGRQRTTLIQPLRALVTSQPLVVTDVE